MSEEEIGIFLKEAIGNEVRADEQTDKYFETSWSIWWGLMGTVTKRGLVIGINNIIASIKNTTDEGV